MRKIQCKRCFFFTPEWCPKKRDSLDPDLIRDCQYFRIKTNADRIRAMTDEELAEWIANDLIEPGYYETGVAKEIWLKWLREEVSDA